MPESGPGFLVALVGHDGAGKTTVGRELVGVLGTGARYLYLGIHAHREADFLPLTRWVLRWKVARGGPPDLSGPAGPSRAPSGAGPWTRTIRRLRDWLRLLLHVPEEWHQLARLARQVRKGRIVVCDRHPLLELRARMGARARWVDLVHARVLARSGAAPDLIVLLEAPSEVRARRKAACPAVPAERADYRRLHEYPRRFATVDATRDLEMVVAAVAAQVRGNRTAAPEARPQR